MRVFGLMTDDEPKVPFPRDGDGHLSMFVLAAAAIVSGIFFLGLIPIGLGIFLACAIPNGLCVKVRLLGGDVYDPKTPWTLKAFKRELGPDGPVRIPPDSTPNWFNALPAGARRFFCPLPLLPYLALGWGRFGYYVGAKRYGFDSPEYLDFPMVEREDVYGPGTLGTPGSEALCLTMRATGARPR